MSKKEVFVGDAEFTFDHGGNPSVWSDHGVHYVTAEEVLELSEWLAEAYIVLTGAEYVHTEYDKGEFVVKEGVPAAVVHKGERVIPKRGAPLPDLSFLRLMSDPGPHDESYGREHTLERDCE